MDTMEIVNKTWEEMGRKIQPLRNILLVRTDPVSEKVGSIFLPHMKQGFYAGMPHEMLAHATVLSVGPKVRLKVGDRVCFTRTNFARMQFLQDGTVVGWIQDQHLAGMLVDETPA
jgi:hypothetical protein